MLIALRSSSRCFFERIYMSEVLIRENEIIDELNDRGYRIIQNQDGFKFGLDSVLLTSFAIIRNGDRVLDMGTGSGVIPILLEAKTKGGHFTGLELQSDVADMAARSVILNELQDKLDIICGDIREIKTIFNRRIFDVVTSNPPYMTVKEGLISETEKKAISRTEVCCKLEDVIAGAAAVLKDKGRFYMVHRPNRLGEIISLMVANRFSVRNIRFVYPREDAEANTVLIEGIWNGKTETILESPCIVFGSDGKYTEELNNIYYKEMLMKHRKGL